MTELITAFTTLFVIIDPIGLAPLFVALTQGQSAAQRRGIAIRACLIALAILVVFAFVGESLLEFVGISMPAFRIAGGILLFLTALEMLFQKRQTRRQGHTDDAAEDHIDDPSVFPIAIPLIAGPGAIATIILLTEEAASVLDYASVFGVLSAVLLLVFLMFLIAIPLERLLGRVGVNVVTRILGMLLAALAIQFILDGLRSFGLAP
ncbi:MarC family transcriptional regulator [Marivivens niveibacter]|uniref:UPF0056 membrane protein n=1 Tax=Marivivens niveibacter TaxID=1930667 RepID=A0A251X3Q7_9RHOB|nr:MarC family protein [Marivivens niveibacter]OUD10783.1 MarC family transcriptional regulator [Marivivens niveibacter]